MSNDTAGYQCNGVTTQQLQFFNILSFWIGGVLKFIICLIGLISNFIAIPVLKSKTLYKSTFNRLLIVLAICDNAYLLLAISECIRQELNMTIDSHNVFFVYFLYPIHNIVLCLSIFMTVGLAKERFKAISDPIDYHAIMVSGRQWQRVFKYVLPVFAMSVLFNLPKFFELKIEYIDLAEHAPSEIREKNQTIKVIYYSFVTFLTWHFHGILQVTQISIYIEDLRIRFSNTLSITKKEGIHLEMEF